MEMLNVMVQAQVTSNYQCRRLCELMDSEETGFTHVAAEQRATT